MNNKKKIKLLHLHAPLRFGGGEVFLSRFYDEKELFENETILFSSSDLFKKELYKIKISFSEFYSKDLKIGSLKKYLSVLFFSLSHIRKFLRILKKHSRPDFVVGHGFPFIVLMPIFRIFHLFPSSVGFLYFQHGRLKRPSKNIFWRTVYKALFSYFDFILVNTTLVRNDILSPIPSLKEKIIIFPTGFNFDKEFSNQAVKLEPPYDRMNDKLLVSSIYAARPSPQKNHKIFIDIFRELKRIHSSQNFKALFPGVEKTSPFALGVCSAGYEDSAIFLGMMSNEVVFSLTRNSDLCIFPSLEEGFGIGILEPISASVPCLVFKSTISEEFSDFVIAASDERDFIQKAVELIQNKEKRLLCKKNLSRQFPEIKKRFDLLCCLENLYAHLSTKLF